MEIGGNMHMYAYFGRGKLAYVDVTEHSTFLIYRNHIIYCTFSSYVCTVECVTTRTCVNLKRHGTE